MSDVDKLIRQIPIGEIATRYGVSKAVAKDGVATAIPALLSGMQANAQDSKGESSLLKALQTKDTGLVEGGIDLGDIDVKDGEKIVRHVFGKATPDVAARLGGTNEGGTGFMKSLMPLLAPLVMAFLAKKALDKVGKTSGGGLGDLIGGMLGGSGGGGLGDLLGGLGGLFGGSSSSSTPKSTTKSRKKKTTKKKTSSSKSSGGGIGDLLGDLLGGGTR